MPRCNVWQSALVRSFEAEMPLDWPQVCVQLALDWPIVVRLADFHLIGNNARWMQGDMFLAARLPIQQDWRWSRGLAWNGLDWHSKGNDNRLTLNWRWILMDISLKTCSKEALCNVHVVNLFHSVWHNPPFAIGVALAGRMTMQIQLLETWWRRRCLVEFGAISEVRWGISGLVQITLRWDTSLHPYRGLVLWLLT